MSALVIGQEVSMKSGPLTLKGTATKITEQYVEVEPFPSKGMVRCVIRFDPRTGKTGSCSEGLGCLEYLGPESSFLLGTDGPYDIPGTKFGPWELVLP